MSAYAFIPLRLSVRIRAPARPVASRGRGVELHRQAIEVGIRGNHPMCVTPFVTDGLEMDTNVVQRAIRPLTVTRKGSLFAGSDAGARGWSVANT